MDPIIYGYLMMVLLIALIVVGVNIGVSLLLTAVLGVWLSAGDFSAAAGLLNSGPFAATFDFTLSVIPLFILMGLFVNASGASRDLYEAGYSWFGRLPGGLGIVTVLANAIFAAVTGVSIASAAVFSKIAVPEMLRLGYEKRFSVGCVAGSSVLGMLIPPSIMFIVYGIVSGESIGKMFIAGIIPGLVLTITYIAGIFMMAFLFPSYIGSYSKPGKIPWFHRLKSLTKCLPIACLIILVLGGIYGGVFTPTEAGAIGCVGALVIMITKGQFNLRNLRYTLMEAGFTTASVFLLFISAQMFGRMLAVSGLVDQISKVITQLSISPSIIILIMLIVYVFLGCFLDVISIILITMPIFLPVVRILNYDPIWFGVLSTMTIETGLMTPPFGMSIFVVKGALGDLTSIEEIFLGSFPFLLILFFTIGIIFAFPSLTTWLPSLM